MFGLNAFTCEHTLRLLTGSCDGPGLISSTGASYNLDDSRARVYCACSRCGLELFGHFFTVRYLFLFLPLFAGRPNID